MSLLARVALAAILAAVLLPAVASADSVTVPPSIDSTGTDDVTAKLNAFIDSVPDRSTITFPADGRYRVEGTLYLTHRHGLTFEGNRSVIFATERGTGDRRHIEAVGGSQLTFRLLQIKGANPKGGTAKEAYVPELEHQHGFSFRGTAGVLLDRVVVSDVYGDFFYLGYDRATLAWARDVTVQDSYFARNGRQGATITGADNVSILRNRFHDVRMNVIDLEPNDEKGGATNVLVKRNTARNFRYWFMPVGGQGDINNVTVADNRAQEHFFSVLIKPRREDVSTVRHSFVFTGNTGETLANRSVFDITGLHSGRISGNYQEFGQAVPAVSLVDSCPEVVVQGNAFPGASTEVWRAGTC